MKSLLLPLLYFGFGVFLIIFGIITYRNQKKSKFFKEKLESKELMPWWYYIGGAIAVILILGQFDKSLTLVGHIIFIVMLGLGINWKLRRR